MLLVKNEVIVSTPFESVKEIKSVFQSSLNVMLEYIIGLDLAFKHHNASKWTESGFYFNFTNRTDESDLRTNDITFNLKTPLENLPRLNMHLILEAEETMHRANFTGNTIYTTLSLAGRVEQDINYIDAKIGFSLFSQNIKEYICNFFFKKDFSENENIVDVGFYLNDEGSVSNVKLESMWHIERANQFKAKAKFTTNLLPIKVLYGEILANKTPNPVAMMEMRFYEANNEATLLKFRATKKKDLVVIDINTPLEDYR